MNFKIVTDDDHEIRPNRKPIVDNSSKSARLRLYMLVGLLILVFYMMSEAGKPERWEWMGFGKAGDAGPNVENTSSNVSATSGGESARLQESSSEPTKDETTKPIESDESLTNNNTKVPELSIKFWNELYPDLTLDQQKLLFALMRSLRNSASTDSLDSAELKKLMKRIVRHRENFHGLAMDQLSLLETGSEQMKDWSEKVHQSEEFWTKKIFMIKVKPKRL